ncbi:MAG: hypothetical protein ACTSVV_10530 [Promethearchaeota archaeon]
MEDLIKILYHLNIINLENNHKFNLNKFHERLFYQKLVFLLCEKVITLNYHFNWYKRGPYSPDLTRDLFIIKDLLENNREFISNIIKTDNSLNSTLKNGIESIKNIKKEFKMEFKREWNAEDLEILASLLFIEKYTYSYCRGSKEKTIEEFKNRKSSFQNKEIMKYYDLLKKANYIQK